MKYLILFVMVAAAAVFVQLPGVADSPQAQSKRHADPATFANENYVAGELLVKVTADAGRSVESAHERIGSSVVREFTDIGYQHVILPEGMSVEEGMQLYKQEAGVAHVQPNFIYRIDLDPDDPSYTSTGLYGIQKISAPAAWNITTGSSNIVVAVLDTGIHKTHPDLTGNVWVNPGETPGDGIDNDANGYVDDTNGYDMLSMDNNTADGQSHGTHVSGTIGAVGNNDTGVVGVNWDVSIMSLKTHDDVAGGSTSATLILSFQYITMMKNRGIDIRATSNSYGGPPEAGTYDQALKDTIDATGRAGIVNCFSAGNQLTVSQEKDNDLVPHYPSTYNGPSILAVASSDSNDNIAGSSHYGLTTVDVAAPGVSVLSTIPTPSPGGYGTKSGTSMAAPHASGAIALLASAHPALSAASLRATLMNTVDVVPAFVGKTVTGGRINVHQAILTPTICNFALSSAGQGFPVEGGEGSFTVTAPANCGSYAFPSQPWVVVTSNPMRGTGTAETVEYTVAPNTSGAGRTATLKVDSVTYTITQAGLTPTAAGVAVSGRVLNAAGRGISRATVVMTDEHGSVRTATTNPFGYYRFNDIAAGQTYVVSVKSKHYRFEPRVVDVNEALTDVYFYGERR